VAELRRSTVRPSITRLGVAFLGTDNRYVIDRARRELGYSPRVSLEDGVRLTAAWYLDGVGARPPLMSLAAPPREEARV
jgi:nucleoside-diphosphate-sugar epimerase